MTQSLLDAQRYGPWAVIAGGSDGTGAAYARFAAEAGINLLLIARRAGPLEEIAAELRAAHGVEVRTLALDLNDEDAAERIAQAAEGLEVGLYVANAGANQGRGSDFLDTDYAEIKDLIARNILTVSASCHHFGAKMRARGRGGIVIMSSGTALGGMRGTAAYSGVKAFQLNLAEALWSELRDAGVHVIGVAAPLMETPTLRHQLGEKTIPGIVAAEDVAREALARLPTGCCLIYAFGQPWEETERQTALRRDRVLQMEAVTAGLFKAP